MRRSKFRKRSSRTKRVAMKQYIIVSTLSKMGGSAVHIQRRRSPLLKSKFSLGTWRNGPMLSTMLSIRHLRGRAKRWATALIFGSSCLNWPNSLPNKPKQSRPSKMRRTNKSSGVGSTSATIWTSGSRMMGMPLTGQRIRKRWDLPQL